MERSRSIITLNRTDYRVLAVTERNYQRTLPGIIVKHLKGERDFKWLIDFTEYHVTAKAETENFNRTFVFTEREAEEVLFHSWKNREDLVI